MSLQHGTILGALLLLLGCEGIGRPIVQEFGVKSPRSPECRRPRPKCETPGPVSVLSDAPRDMELAACGDPTENSELGYCELRLAPQPGSLSLSGMKLVHVRIVLAAGQQLTLAESELVDVAILGEELSAAGRAGEAFISHSKVQGLNLGVGHLQLLSSEIESSRIDARQLIGDDVVFTRTDMTVNEARLAAIDLRRSALRGCAGGVLIAGSKVLRSQLLCEGTLQIYTTPVDLSVIDGDVEAHAAAFADGSFGVEHSTSLTSWVGSLDNMVFCGQAESVHVSGGLVECVDCEGPIAEPEPDACVDEEEPVELLNNVCAALKDPGILCEDFAPPRRPIEGI
jgi:hypothetical protein